MSYEEFAKWTLTFVWIAFLGLLILVLVGCGKKGDPIAAGPTEDIHYPRVYPPDGKIP